MDYENSPPPDYAVSQLIVLALQLHVFDEVLDGVLRHAHCQETAVVAEQRYALLLDARIHHFPYIHYMASPHLHERVVGTRCLVQLLFHLRKTVGQEGLAVAAVVYLGVMAFGLEVYHLVE